MDNFNLDELMDLDQTFVGPVIDAIYRRLMDRDFALENPEVIMLLAALINILGHDNRGDRPTEVLLMAAYGQQGVLDRPNMRVMRWRNGALSGSDLANEPGLGRFRTYQPGETLLPTKPRPRLRRMHQEVRSEAASSSSQLRGAVPTKRARVEEEVQMNETMIELNETKDELERVKKTLLRTEEDPDMWRSLFKDCNKKRGEEIERLRQEYKERSQRLPLTTAAERTMPERDVPSGQSPMELLTPRELSQTTELQIPTATGRVTIPDPSDTLGDPAVEQTMQKLRESAGRLVANRSVRSSGVTAPYGRLDNTGRVELSSEVMKKTGAAAGTKPTETSKASGRKTMECP